ncbi:MAG: PD-(D/E)XK nuclease family protein [Candidatus Paceibacterota bacterium]
MNFYQRFPRTFEPGKPFKLSRSKLEQFINCPRCFYLDRRLGIGQPPGYPFTLNSAVDTLLKSEFDIHRAEKTTHPLMKQYDVDAVPFQHPLMDVWRETFKGIEYYHEPTQLTIGGAIDDIWVTPQGELLIVDYKATSTTSEITMDAEYRQGYKRQMEIYQWLYRKNGFKVSSTGYFVYANGKKDKEAFDGKLEFDVQIISYEGDDSWVEHAITDAHNCLLEDTIPEPAPECLYCAYRKKAAEAEKWE